MHMLSLFFTVLLLAIAMIAVVLRKVYTMVPERELKRQAADHNQLAKQLYEAVSYGGSLRSLLWMVIAFAGAGSFVLLAQATAGLIAVCVVALALWVAFAWLPSTRVSSVGVRLTTLLTPVVVWLLRYTDPVLRRVYNLATNRYVPSHSGLYELEDLLDLLALQADQPDSRITTEELLLIRSVLQFGDHKVRDVLRPRKQVKAVALSDAIGPVLLDELHASGQTVFPVKKAPRSTEIVASLHLGDLSLHSTGTVEDYASKGVTYMHESDNLADALHAFYQTKRQLFVVINSFEEYVGVLTLEDILHTLVGRPEPDESLGSHEDSAHVAARHSHKPTAPVAETAETVVE